MNVKENDLGLGEIKEIKIKNKHFSVPKSDLTKALEELKSIDVDDLDDITKNIIIVLRSLK